MENTETADVIVIGGGVIGAAVAYYLAVRKVRVLLLEKKDLAAGSSGACDGLVFLQSKKPGVHLRLAMRSRELFETLAETLPVPVEYRPSGGLIVIETEEEAAAMETFVSKQRQSGLDVTLLSAEETREREPALAETIVGAAYSPMDGKINPLALTHGFAQGAKAHGADIRTHTAVTGFRQSGGRVTGVVTGRGTFTADVFVNAAGVYAPDIAAFLGFSVPIHPRRGQILVTEAVSPTLGHALLSARYIAAKYDPALAEKGGQGVSMEQTEHGNILVGSTREFAGYNRNTTIEGIGSVAARAAALVPGLKNIHVIRAFAGLRPYTPDGLPMLGKVAGLDNLVMAAGHEGDGIALSAVTGQLIANLIVDGETDPPLSEFSPNRFIEKAPPAGDRTD
jgi:sarcosine oxidase subunit beta